jgi:signal recognition particle receptor subunit beta
MVLYPCYLGGLFIAIAYYWNDLIYELSKFDKSVRKVLNILSTDVWENTLYYLSLFKNYVIENYNHNKDEDIELNDKTDCFGTLNKVNVIEEGFKNQILKNHKIISIYGNWGCGKSSVIRTLIERLDENRKPEKNIELNEFLKNLKEYIIHIFKHPKDKSESIVCIKFDAWEYENEENIAYALLNKIIEELEKDADVKYGIKSIKNKILKSGAVVLKSVGVNAGIFNLNFECDSEGRYKEVENLKNGLSKISEILSENNKRLIVFVDELDRCERENILKFLASLKLFFTSGDNINYVCAVDKEAVAEALEHKYGDGEKAEEYLEKIFNFSFNMPKTFNVKKFIRQYGFNNAQSEKLAEFFEAINFTTPRHLKKVLNKYDYLVELKTSDGISEDLKNLIPDLIRCPHMVQTSKIELTKYYYYIKKDKKLYQINIPRC